jgi:hypothetical protein
MPEVGFEPTIPVFERAKTVHALDRATTVIGIMDLNVFQIRRHYLYQSGNLQTRRKCRI